MNPRKQLSVGIWPLQNNIIVKNQLLTYRIYGKQLGTAPVIVINHAMHSDSDCALHWEGILGEKKAIDLDFYTVICFDVPGKSANEIAHFRKKEVKARDVAVLFWLALFELGVEDVFAIIGADLGGGIAWEMATLFPKRIQNLLPIAALPLVNDWVENHPTVENEWYKELFLSVNIAENRRKWTEVIQAIQASLHILHVQDLMYYNQEKEQQFYQQLKLIKPSAEFYTLDTLHNNRLILEKEQVDEVVDKILQKALRKVA